MSKTRIEEVLGLYDSILEDVAIQVPSLAKEMRKYKSRLRLLVENRGLVVLTIAFPQAGKVLERSLSRGLNIHEYPNEFGYWCGSGPRLFLGLFQMIFDKDGKLLGDYSVEAVFFLRQILYAVKKLRMECSDERLYAAVSDLEKTEATLPCPSLDWHGDRLLSDDPLLSSGSRLELSDRDSSTDGRPLFRFGRRSDGRSESGLSSLLVVAQAVSDRWASMVGEVDPYRLQGRHGRGSVSDGSPRTWKYHFPSWGSKLSACFPYDWFGSHNLGWDSLDVDQSPETSQSRGLNVPGLESYEGSSKLIAVPKTQKGPRLIASEPTAHQWMQQAMFSWFQEKIAGSFVGNSVDLRNQKVSRDLCLSASKDGRLATVDLSEASDRISCWLVERMFRSNLTLLDALHSIRTRLLQNTIDKKTPRYIRLRKFTTMGSAVTFPVQSVIFSILAVSAVIHSRGWKVSQLDILRASRMVRVFGDDIIVPKEDYGTLVRLLESLFLKVNETKSFATGPFRESCGMDAVGGYSVTPAYYLQGYESQNPESVASVVEASNNFYKVGLWKTSDYILHLLPPRISATLVTDKPRAEADWTSFGSPVERVVGAGLTLTCVSGASYPGRRRWNKDLHREEARTWAITAKAPVERIDSFQCLLQWFTEAPKPDKWGVVPLWRSGKGTRPRYSLVPRWVPT